MQTGVWLSGRADAEHEPCFGFNTPTFEVMNDKDTTYNRRQQPSQDWAPPQAVLINCGNDAQSGISP